MRVTLKAANEELSKRGFSARLVKASGYFYFQGGDADQWLDKTVSVARVSGLSLPEWIAEFERLKKLNGEIIGGKGGKPVPKRKQSKVRTSEDVRFKGRPLDFRKRALENA